MMTSTNKSPLCILIIFLCSCSTPKTPECNIPIGKLLFSDVNINWGKIYLGESYTDTISIYNPLEKEVHFKISDNFTEYQIRKLNYRSLDIVKEGITVGSHSYETLLFTFTPRDSSLFGSYFKCLHIAADDEIFITPLTMTAIIVEKFDSVAQHTALRPILEVEKDTLDFGTISTKDHVLIPIPIKNIGKQALIIRKVETDCTCTSSNSNPKIIQPGQSDSLEIIFKPMGRQGKQHKTIKMYCNDPQKQIVEFTVKGFIQHPQ